MKDRTKLMNTRGEKDLDSVITSQYSRHQAAQALSGQTAANETTGLNQKHKRGTPPVGGQGGRGSQQRPAQINTSTVLRQVSDTPMSPTTATLAGQMEATIINRELN